MCLAFLSRNFLRIDLVEQIWLVVSADGRCRSEEVYDVFFKAPGANKGDSGTKSPTILCISPHNLTATDGQLLVTVEPFPGRGNSHDRVYSLGAKYNPNEQTFTAELRSTTEAFQPGTDKCAGTVVCPRIRIPKQLGTESATRQILERIGTFFEVQLENLEPDNNYALRLVVRPDRLNLPTEPMNISEVGGVEGTDWEQDLSIIAPTVLFSNLQTIVEHLSKTDASAVVPIQTVLSPARGHGSAKEWKVALVRRHRLFVIFPPGCSLIDRGNPGCAWFVGAGQFVHTDATTSPIPIPMRMMEWAGGTERYPGDDPFEVAKKILSWVREWGSADSKTKEEITTSLRLNHGNVSLLVNELAKAQLLKDDGKGRYTVGSKCEWSTRQIDDGKADQELQKIASSQSIVRAFVFSGFEIKYTLSYKYESHNVVHRRRMRQFKDDINLGAGIVGTVIAIMALGVSVWEGASPRSAVTICIALILVLAIACFVLWRRVRKT